MSVRAGTCLVSNNSLCATLKQRLKVYTPAEILSVVKNCVADDFHKKEKLKLVTPEYVLRLKTIEMYKSSFDDEQIEEERPMVY